MKTTVTPKELNTQGQEVWSYRRSGMKSTHGTPKAFVKEHFYTRVEDEKGVRWLRDSGYQVAPTSHRYLTGKREQHIQEQLKFESI